MKLRIRTKMALPAVVIALIISTGTAGASTVPQPPASVGTGTDISLPTAVANAKFVNQYGQTETLASQNGRTIFLVPFLTLCGDTCPFTTGNMIQLQSLLTRAKAYNVEVIGIDVDPYRDTRARIAAYAKLIGANFQLWTEFGPTSTPTLSPREINAKTPVGKGDINANLLALEKFLGWTVQVVPQSVPPGNDWMAPHDQLSYDIAHSDGFWIIDAKREVRFASGDQPAFTGTLSKVLSAFMGYKSNIYKTAIYKRGWTPTQGLRAIEWVTQTSY